MILSLQTPSLKEPSIPAEDPEPEESDQTTTICFRKNNEKLQRRFLKNSPIANLLRFCSAHWDIPESAISLESSFPRKKLTNLQLTIQEENLNDSVVNIIITK